MMKKITKFAVLFLTVAVARTAVIPEEFAPPTTPKVKAIEGTAVDWVLFSVGALLGSAIETGTNIGLMPNKYIRCVA